VGWGRGGKIESLPIPRSGIGRPKSLHPELFPTKSGFELDSRAGFLAYGSSPDPQPSQPDVSDQWLPNGHIRIWLSVYSGGTAADLHGLSFTTGTSVFKDHSIQSESTTAPEGCQALPATGRGARERGHPARMRPGRPRTQRNSLKTWGIREY